MPLGTSNLDILSVTGISGPASVKHQRFTAPKAADLVSVVAAVLPSNVALTLALQPDWPRKLAVRIVIGGTAITGGICTIVGTNQFGQAITEVVSIIRATSATLVTANAFAHVTSATVSALAGTMTSNTIGIGLDTALGLSASASPAAGGAFAVFKANVDNLDEAVGTVDATAGTISPTTAPNATHNYDFWSVC